MVNQERGLNVAHLNQATGDAIYGLLEETWPFAEQRASGIIPVNHVLRYSVVPGPVDVGAPLLRRTRLSLVTRPGTAGQPYDKVHVHGQCELFTTGDGDRQVGSADYWIALTRLFEPAGRRKLTEIPKRLQQLSEQSLDTDAPPAWPLERFVLPDPDCSESYREVIHINQTDINHHVNTGVYLDTAQDKVANLLFGNGYDVSGLRFYTIDVLYRKPFSPGQPIHVLIDAIVRDQSLDAVVRFLHDCDGQPASRLSVGVRLTGAVGVSPET